MKQQVRNKLHGKAGFTLVELIVVIAILGILAGIGTVGYSGYIKKAHQAADIQLIGDVAYAFQMGAVSDNGANNAGVVLRYNEGPLISSSAEEYLKAMFGDDLSGLKLQYDGWAGGSGGSNFITLVAGQPHAADVNNSAYLQKSTVPELLGNVKAVTTAASEFLDVQNPETMYSNLRDALGDNFTNMAEAAGLRTNEAGTAFEGVTNDQISNLMVLSVAKELNGMDATQVKKYLLETSDAPQISVAAGMAVEYAVLKAYALQSGNNELFNQMNAQLSTATNMSQVRAAFSVFASDTGAMSGYNEYLMNSDDFTVDMNAFGSIMGAVDSVSGDYTNADALSNPDLYISGGVSEQLNSYITAAAVAGELGEDARNALASGGDGTVAVSMTIGANGIASIGVTPAAAYAG